MVSILHCRGKRHELTTSGPIDQMAAKEEDSTQIEGIYTTDVDDADESISSASTEKAVEQLDGLTLGTKNTMDMPPTPPPSAQY